MMLWIMLGNLARLQQNVSTVSVMKWPISNLVSCSTISCATTAALEDWRVYA